MNALRGAGELFIAACKKWIVDDISRLGAALAYYAVFSAGPCILLVLQIVGLALGRDVANTRIRQGLEDVVGKSGAEALGSVVDAAARLGEEKAAPWLVTGFLLFAAGGAFHELKASLNMLWRVKAQNKSGIVLWIRDRAIAVGAVFVVAAVVTASLAISTLLHAADAMVLEELGVARNVVTLVDNLLFLVVFAALTGASFRFFPDTRVTFGDVWIGAGLTAVLFLVGKIGVGVYIARSELLTLYGAASSILILLVWIYYSAQVYLIGAAFTVLYAERYGSRRGGGSPAADAATAAT